MCGRKTLIKGKSEILDEMLVDDWNSGWLPSYNISPSQINPILLYDEKRYIRSMRWGLIPYWAKDVNFRSQFINARIETLSEKPSFKKLLKLNRCVIIADGYYEWMKIDNTKQPYYIHSPNKNIMPMAGLWDSWINENNSMINTYTVITTKSAKSIAHIHSRMPAILNHNEIDDWLNADNSIEKGLNILFSNEVPLKFYPVTNFVNSPKNNSQMCIDPLNQDYS